MRPATTLKLQLITSKTSCHLFTSCIENRGGRTFWLLVFFFYFTSFIPIDHATTPCFQIGDNALKTVKLLKIHFTFVL